MIDSYNIAVNDDPSQVALSYDFLIEKLMKAR